MGYGQINRSLLYEVHRTMLGLCFRRPYDQLRDDAAGLSYIMAR